VTLKSETGMVGKILSGYHIVGKIFFQSNINAQRIAAASSELFSNFFSAFSYWHASLSIDSRLESL
jgi:hypothetical protein